MSDLIEKNNNKKKGLGRGIGSLLGGPSDYEKPSKTETKPAQNKVTLSPTAEQNVAAVKPQPLSQHPDESINRIWNLSIEKLKPSPFQPRQNFEKKDLEELAASIRQKGIFQPIVARKSGQAFEIIAGERRWRAAQMAGLHQVPVILKDYDDLETLELAIIENIQRADLNPIEEAEAYSRLSSQFDLTQAQIAEKVGKERATVANALRLLQLSHPIRDLVQQGLLSVGHAKVLLGLSNEKKALSLAKKAIEDGLSVRKLELLIKKHLSDNQNSDSAELSAAAQLEEKLINDLQDKLQKKLNTKVEINYHPEGKGSFQIYFYNKEQFNHLLEVMNK